MLLICDCDGVLVDSEPLAAEAMSGVLAEFGVIMPAERLMRELTGLSQADILAGVAARTGQAVPAAVAERLWPATRALFEARLRALPGALAFLRAHDGPVCVASSSGPERIRFSLERAGLAGCFGDRVFSAAQVARGKPAPDLFLFAAARCGADPPDCVVIEDSVAGVTAAKAAGMTAIGFVGGGHATPASAERLRAVGADRVIAEWAQLAPTLACVRGAPAG
jgi:HAD superfamily hydrolase (TIGR01509 family)